MSLNTWVGATPKGLNVKNRVNFLGKVIELLTCGASVDLYRRGL